MMKNFATFSYINPDISEKMCEFIYNSYPGYTVYASATTGL